MAVESAAERLTFVNPDEFGVTATYTPLAGSPTSVNGVFDKIFFSVDVDAYVPVESAQPRFTARTADLPNVSHGATLVIDSVTYTVKGVQPDGEGFTALVLEGA